MTFPAARELDPVTHDLTVPSGVILPPPTGPCPQGMVMIENQPAAHMGCAVACSGALSAGVAHPPPPVQPLIVVGSGTVMIHGMPAARWAPAPDFSTCGTVLGDPKLAIGRTVFIGGPSSLTVSIANLGALLQAKLDAINKWDASAQADFQKWFGKTDESSRQIVIRRIGKMQNLLKGYKDSNFRGAGAQNADGLFAFVDPVDDTVVSIGNAWATAPMTGTDSQAGALGHEMSHFKSVGGTDDHVYGANPSKDLAQASPDRALDNADNFEYYLEDAP